MYCWGRNFLLGTSMENQDTSVVNKFGQSFKLTPL